MGIPDHLTCLLKKMYATEEATARIRHGTDMVWLKTRKGVQQSCILLPINLTYMQSTSCEMPGWMNHKLEARLPGEISTTSEV